MAIRTIVKEGMIGDDILHKVCRPVEVFDEKLHTLLDDMRETMHAANGYGLAAPQVGIMRRVCVVDAEDGYLELVNPVFIEKKGKVQGVEGCLSFPGIDAVVNRPAKVVVEAYDRYGKKFTVTGEGRKAVGLCHEIDHLDGITVKDVMIRALTEDEY